MLASVFCCVGESFRRAGSYEQALDYLNAALQERLDPIDAYLLRGLTYWSQGRRLSAERDWAAVWSAKPEFLWLRSLLSGARSVASERGL